MRKNMKSKNLIVIKRCNKLIQALKLPKVLNVNPRSIYNKKNQLETFIKEESVDLICMSETFEREENTLEKLINIDNYEVISNIYQRAGKGGRPAVIVNRKMFKVENLTNTQVSIPWGVEVVWVALTPLNVNNASKIQKVIVASIYSKPGSRKKTLLLDHIAQVYSQFNTKYKNGLHWILAGDTNDLNLNPILSLNSNLKQLVTMPTRLNPPRILDPIITSLSDYYQVPVCLPPLDPDPEFNGKPSDHKMVLMSPINVINNIPARTYKNISFRVFSEENIERMKTWLSEQNWNDIINEKSPDIKAECFQAQILSKVDEFFPIKQRKIASDDQPFFTEKLKRLKRKKCRIYRKYRKSEEWRRLEEIYNLEIKKAKKMFYRQKIHNLRKSNPRNWHKELKKMTNFDQYKDEKIEVEEIKDLSIKEQAEKIADKFSEVSQEYDRLENDDIKIPEFSKEEIPMFEEFEVQEILSKMDTNKSDVKGDIPVKILKLCSVEFAKPITSIINSSISQGVWPKIFKMEIVTPVPKQTPTKTIDQLRNISGLLNLDKIAEKLIAKLIISDMKRKLDPSQYANQPGLSIQHYLVKFINRILESLDKSSKKESCAILATLVDWKQAFPRQCPKLGVESFLKNGVRPSLIPVLISYF